MKGKTILIVTAMVAVATWAATAALIAFRNLSTTADNFELDRRVVFKPEAIVSDFDLRTSEDEKQ